MSTEFESWRQSAASAAAKRGASLPEEHILENMFDDGCEPDDAIDSQVLGRYARSHSPRTRSRADVSEILAEHRRQDG